MAFSPRLKDQAGGMRIQPVYFTRRTIEKKFENERDATERFREIMQPYFILREQVQMRHYDGSSLRIDFIGRPKNPELMPWLPWCGFELKANIEAVGDLCRALKQGAGYKDARIVDKRFPRLQGQQPQFVFVYPDAGDEDFGCCKSWYGGVVRMAGQFNVGLVRLEDYYGQRRVVLHVSATRLWSSDAGSNGQANMFGTARRRGA